MEGKDQNAVFGKDLGGFEVIEVELKLADGVAGAVGKSDSV
jgi:hypothetical protein